MELKKNKSSNWIILFALPIFTLSGIGWIAGLTWIYLISGFANGQNFIAKLSGYETNEQLVNRVVAEQMGKTA